MLALHVGRESTSRGGDKKRPKGNEDEERAAWTWESLVEGSRLLGRQRKASNSLISDSTSKIQRDLVVGREWNKTGETG